MVEASSMELSICSSVVVPDSIATGIFRNTNTITRMAAVPVSTRKPVLKARM